MKKITYIIILFVSIMCFKSNVNAAMCCSSCNNIQSSAAKEQCLKNCEKCEAYCDCNRGCNCNGNATAITQCQKGCNKQEEPKKEWCDCEKGCYCNGNGQSITECQKKCGYSDEDYRFSETPSSGGNVPSGGGNNVTGNGSSDEIHDVGQTVTGADENEDDLECNDLFGDDTATGRYMKDIYNIIKFLVPILLLGLSIKDYATAIINQNQDGVKKATKSFIKRLVVAIIILVMPTIINFILEDLLEINQCI